jgi:hypothetical protein
MMYLVVSDRRVLLTETREQHELIRRDTVACEVPFGGTMHGKVRGTQEARQLTRSVHRGSS